MASDYSCAICLDSATNPVVTKCGHLYCWPCLDQWLARQPECPTCKGAINADKAGDIIPLYGKGKQSADASAPPAPSPERNSSAASSSAATGEQPNEANAHNADADNATNERQHAFNTRHERPRAQRQAPVNDNRRAMPRFGRNSWGLCLVGAPTILSDTPIIVVVLICVAAYYIYKYWKQRGANMNGNAQQAHDGVPQAAAGGEAPYAQFVNFMPALLVLCIAFLSIFMSMIAVDDE